jgi:transcriptional regulation of recombination Mhr1
MKQLPFIAKKSKPSKLRRDLWSPMALIQFPAGAGVVGQNAFQKLREFRKRHELEWSDDMLYKTEEKKGFPDEKQRTCRTRVERGHAVHSQRANAIADIAAVLAGRGRGNRLWLNAEEVALLAEGKEDLRGARWSKMGPTKHLPDGRSLLVDTKVYWKNQDDVNYAEKWSENVVHESLEEFEARQAAEAAKAEAETEAEVIGEEAAVEKPAEEATKA